MAINILPTGVVEFVRVNEDGSKWRTTITPGDVTEAQKHLSKKQMDRVKEAWTPELVQKWQAEHPADPPRVGARPRRIDARLDELEAKLAQLQGRMDAIAPLQP